MKKLNSLPRKGTNKRMVLTECWTSGQNTYIDTLKKRVQAKADLTDDYITDNQIDRAIRGLKETGHLRYVRPGVVTRIK